MRLVTYLRDGAQRLGALVIFGGTGDLSRRKILPGLFRRFVAGQNQVVRRLVAYAVFGEGLFHKIVHTRYRRGFGSDLIEGRIPYELGGKGKISIGPGGARCHLEFPLKDGDSILATDAPAPTTIFGGTLDMTGAPDLSGLTVLVVEDDYYIAGDTAAALRGAGATVLGACPSEQAALELAAPEGRRDAVSCLHLEADRQGTEFELAGERGRGLLSPRLGRQLAAAAIPAGPDLRADRKRRSGPRAADCPPRRRHAGLGDNPAWHSDRAAHGCGPRPQS